MIIKNYFILFFLLFLSCRSYKKNDFRNTLIGKYNTHIYRTVFEEHKNSIEQLAETYSDEKMIGESVIEVEKYSDSGITIQGKTFPSIQVIDSATASFGNLPYSGHFYYNGDSINWIYASDNQVNSADSLLVLFSYKGHKIK